MAGNFIHPRLTVIAVILFIKKGGQCGSSPSLVLIIRVVPDIRPFFISGIRRDIRLAE